MPKKKILFVNQEITPYLPSDENSSLAKQLLQGMQSSGFEVRTVMPKFGAVNERRNQLHEVIRLSGMNIPIDDNDHPLIIKVASLQPSRIQVYFIDNDDYFIKSDEDADPAGSNRNDNDQRALFFARGTLETVKKLSWTPEILHCSGWITAMTPLYFKKMSGDNSFRPTKIIYTVTDGQITGEISERIFDRLKEDGVKPAEIRKFKELPLNTNLFHRMAMEYSAGVIFLTEKPDPELLAFAEEKGLPYMLREDALGGTERYVEFYNQFLK